MCVIFYGTVYSTELLACCALFVINLCVLFVIILSIGNETACSTYLCYDLKQPPSGVNNNVCVGATHNQEERTK